ncbi:phosphopantetheine-binding protein [Candidatus Pelagibacter sp.]|jgi:acyl carrier protein|nr:phosphopantetheine-binding protein [Candidatus Pelagibacter sp.]
MDQNQIAQKLKKIIEKQTEKTIKDEFVDIDIDSFTMMLVITFADQELGVRLDMEQLDFDKFKSLNDLAKVIIDSK